MATAAELLAGMSTGDDTTLVIDNYLRSIQIPKRITNLGVEHDDDVLTLNFKMPRYLDGIDLSNFSIRINYINANGDSDAYTINDSDKTVAADFIKFSWLVGPTATAYQGTTKFNVCMKTMKTVDGQQVIDKEYNTTIASLPVLEGLEVDESIVTQYSDIIEQWRQDLLDVTEAKIDEITEASQDAYAAFKESVDTYVEENVSKDWITTSKTAEEGVRTKADAIKSTAEGTTIVVSDSSDDHLRNLQVFGNTTQTSTIGTQLFDPYAQQNNSFGTATISGNGSEITVAGTYYVSWPIVLKAGITYYINFETAGAGTQRAVRFEYGDKEITNTLTNPGTFTPTRDTVSVYLYSGLGTENCVVYKNFQISEGSDPVSWEPYSAGNISPTPIWSQSLRSVNSPEVSVVGKNLLDMSSSGYYVDGALKIPYTSYNSIAGGFNKIRVYPGKTYTFSYKFTTGDRLILNFLDGDEQPIGDVKIGWGEYLFAYHGRYGTVGSGATFTIPEDSNVAFLVIHMCQMNECGEGNFNYYYDLQLEEGDVVTEYEPYKTQQKVIIPYELNGIPVTSDGNHTDSNGQQWVCDEIDFERGVYIQNVHKVILDGTENVSREERSGGTYRYVIRQYNPVKVKPTLGGYCSHFKYNIASIGANDINDVLSLWNTGYPYCRCDSITTVDSMVSWLMQQYEAGTPVTIMGVLETPIETPLTAEEIAAFKALRSNYPNTTVLNDSGAHMALTYNVDTKTYVDNGIKQTVAEVMEAIENGSY